MKPISYEANGFPEFLRTEAACQRAIEKGQVRAETPIVAYGEDGERLRMAAGEHPLLREMLGLGTTASEEKPHAPEDPANGGKSSQPVSTAETIAPDVIVTPEDAANPETRQPLPASTGPIRSRTPTDPAPSLRKIFGWLIAALVVSMIAMRGCASDSPVANTKGSNESNTVAAAVDPDAGLVEETFYAVRQIAVRAKANSGSVEVGRLERGAELVGVVVPAESNANYRWLKIKQGPFTGNFVSMLNLSETQRPVLDAAQAGTWYTLEALTPLQAPNDSSPQMTNAAWSLATGQKLEVAGVTGAGTFTKGWAEVMMEKQTGVGYVPFDRLTQNGDLALDGPMDSVEEPRALGLVNQCGEPITLLLRFQDHYGWQTVRTRLPDGIERDLGLNGARAQLVSGEVYFAFLTIGDVPVAYRGTKLTTMFEGKSYDLNRLSFDVVRDDRYRATFTCK
ncbi:hypothetical protein [Sphingomonas colocasiae]|uniref:SH3 domain-containing protein n=1 Tax=Sphingomonas colocasiae TaxID=1848973 RepID=A0ABS7PYW2_9SPHN|nr:hypothetical protein [Sphingomonas colocasiae]MBY8825527.1 hypothetical protein [Sphingomonas colocasiae]